MRPLESWWKESWIKTTTREKFIEWCGQFKPEYTAEEAGWIYDSHVPPKEPVTPPSPQKSTQRAASTSEGGEA